MSNPTVIQILAGVAGALCIVALFKPSVQIVAVAGLLLAVALFVR